MLGLKKIPRRHIYQPDRSRDFELLGLRQLDNDIGHGHSLIHFLHPLRIWQSAFNEFLAQTRLLRLLKSRNHILRWPGGYVAHTSNHNPVCNVVLVRSSLLFGVPSLRPKFPDAAAGREYPARSCPRHRRGREDPR